MDNVSTEYTSVRAIIFIFKLALFCHLLLFFKFDYLLTLSFLFLLLLLFTLFFYYCNYFYFISFYFISSAIFLNFFYTIFCKKRCVDLDSTISIPRADVTFLDANHCPGAVLLLFKIFDNEKDDNNDSNNNNNNNNEIKIINKSNENIILNSENKQFIDNNKNNLNRKFKYFLHTGDMRFHKNMKEYKSLQNIKIEKIFLDTTYAHPKHKVSSNISIF